MKSAKHKPTGSRKARSGGPSGFVVSLVFHGVVFFLAGIFVVFQVLPKEMPEFEVPPPVERPRMNLKKPKVKVQKSSSPKPSSRIVAKVKTARMPEIQVPDLMGSGTGLLGGIGLGGDFLELPDITTAASAFGEAISTGNDLVGVFYDFKRTRSGNNKPIFPDYYSRPNTMDIIIGEFLQKDWNTRLWAKYYRAPRKLYTSAICIGTMDAVCAPEAFGEMDTPGYAWGVLYQGKLVYPEDIKFRFRGVGESFMAVRVNGKLVMLSVYHAHRAEDYYSAFWTSHASDNWVYAMADSKQEVGDWIELEAGKPADIQILIADLTGGLVTAQLAVEVEGEDYPRNPASGGPTCPVFKTDNLSRTQIDSMYVDVFPGDICLTNGPVFCDYVPVKVRLDPPSVTNVPPVYVKESVKQERTWTCADGVVLLGKLLINYDDEVLLETGIREQKRIPKRLLSEEDLAFLDLSNPPRFNIEFSKTSDQIDKTKKAPPNGIVGSLAVFEYRFGVKLKSSVTINYNHPLKIEYFAIGSEIGNGDNYILLDRQSDEITPGRSNGFKYEFHGPKVILKKYKVRDIAPMRGRKPDGYLIVVTDQEGRIVQYETSNDFLFNNLERLKALPVNAFFDKHCNRAYPTRPTDADRPTWNL